MLRKFIEGLVFGSGFAIAYLTFWYAGDYWISPRLAASTVAQINRQMFAKAPPTRSIGESSEVVEDERPFHTLPIEDRIAAASVIALARYEKSDDGRMRAIIKEFLKKAAGTTIYFDIGDEYIHSSFYPKENISYGDGVIIFFTGSPAMMKMSMTFSGDRIAGLGDLPIALLKEKCAAAQANEPADQ